MSKKKETIRYGRCTNPECSNVGVSDVMPEDGRCPYCGRDDTMELDEDTPPLKAPKRWPKYVVIACATLAIIGGAIYGVVKHSLRTPDDGSQVLLPPNTTSVTLPTQPTDTLIIISEQETPVPDTSILSATNTPSTPKKPSHTLAYGEWTGNFKNNQPDGIGTLTYKVRHRIDPRDVKERVAEEGDYIIGEFSQGKLVQGIWYDKNNRQKGAIIIGK